MLLTKSNLYGFFDSFFLNSGTGLNEILSLEAQCAEVFNKHSKTDPCPCSGNVWPPGVAWHVAVMIRTRARLQFYCAINQTKQYKNSFCLFFPSTLAISPWRFRSVSFLAISPWRFRSVSFCSTENIQCSRLETYLQVAVNHSA